MTTISHPYELAHLVQVVTDDRTGHRAECSCGWTAPWTDDPAAAEVTADDHREVAVGPPTGLDATLSGLLDLQDDLAETVMWLAENWSADLPTPHATSSCRYLVNGDAIPGVRLLAYCDTQADLARVADLLGTAPTADAAPNSRGDRWERAVRCFGRVELDAYRSFDPDIQAAVS
jgi:hypothetical protein